MNNLQGMRAEYMYGTIDGEKGEFRMLVLEPSRHEWAMICCRLERTCITNTAEYQAVSYTWGEPRATHRILIDGQQHAVTKNVHSFLKQQRAHSDREQRLWIDSLCINQSDNKEKMHQIGLMKDIYQNTAQLLIWLGDRDEDSWSDYAMDVVEAFLPNDSTITHPPTLDEEQMHAFQSLLERPWWYRVWITQELVLGAHGQKAEKAQVICGSKRLQWVTLVKAMRRLQEWNTYQRQQFPFVTSVLDLENFRRGHDQNLSSDARSLYWWLHNTQDRKVSDERDKIYGLMGIIDPSDEVMSSLQPDYTRSIATLYTDVARRLIEGPVGMELLRECGEHQIDGLPSWVPDWSAGRSIRPFWSAADAEDREKAFDISQRMRALALIPNEAEPIIHKVPAVTSHYWASKETPQDVTFASNLTSIKATGIKFDKIKLSHAPFIGNITEPWYNTTLFMIEVSKCKAVYDDNEDVPNPYGTTEARDEAFWRALLADHSKEGGYQPDLNPNDYFTSIPSDWTLKKPYITATNVGLWRLAKIQSQLMRQMFAIYLKRTDREAGGLSWRSFAVEDVELPKLDYEDLRLEIGNVTLDQNRIDFILAFCDGMPEINPTQIKYICEKDADLATAAMVCKDQSELYQMRDNLLEEAIMFSAVWLGECEGKHDLTKSPFDLEKVIPDPYHHMRPELRVNYSSENTKSLPENENSSDTAAEAESTTLQKVSYSIESEAPGSPKYALGRRFIITDKGYVGIAPPEAEEDDIVAVIFGCNAPMVLRPYKDENSTCFKVVGEAHIQGIMDGEVIEAWRKGDFETQLFMLI